MSMSTGMKHVSERWRRAARALKAEDQKFGIMLAEAIVCHKGPEYAMFDDPLEATVYLLLIDMVKRQERGPPAGIPDAVRSAGMVPE